MYVYVCGTVFSKGTRQGHMAYRLAHPIPSCPSSDVRHRPSLSITAQAAVSHLVPAHSTARGLCHSHLPRLLMSVLPNLLCLFGTCVRAVLLYWRGIVFGRAMRTD